MKKLVLIPLLIMICTDSMNAYVEKRYTWWNMRVKRLEKLLVDMRKNRNTDRSAKSLIMNDIRSGRDFIAFHNRKIFRKLEKRKIPDSITNSSMKSEIKSLIFPVAAFQELEELIRSLNSPETVKNVKRSAERELEKILKDQSGVTDKEFLEFMMDSLAKKIEWKRLSLEVVLCKHLSGIKIRMKKNSDALSGTVMFRRKNRIEVFGPGEFTQRVTEWAIETYPVSDIRGETGDLKSLLEGSARWQYIKKRAVKLTAERGGYQNILRDFKKDRAVLARRINRFLSKPVQENEEDYALILKNNRIYFERIQWLLNQTIPAGIHACSYMEGRISATYRRIVDIYRYLVSMPGPKNGSGNRLLNGSTGKKVYGEELRKIKGRIDRDYRVIFSRISSYRKKVKELGKGIRKYTAQHELNLILSLIEDYSKAFGKYSYESEFLNAYSAEFNILMKQIKSRNYKAVRGESNMTFSLLKNMRFNSERLRMEEENKGIIRKEGLRLISSLSYLVNYYRRKNADIHYYPAARYIRQLENRFKGNPGVKIGSWTMTSDNYATIDRNVSALVWRMIGRNSWLEAGRDKTGDKTASSYPVEISEVRLSLKIPRGWFEGRISQSERSRGIIKKYLSIDKSSSINLARIYSGSGESMDIKKAGEKWAGSRGVKPVMKKWGKKENRDYYWILTRDGSGAIYEIYVLKRTGYAVILSGRTDPGKHRFFRERLASVFDSIVLRF